MNKKLYNKVISGDVHYFYTSRTWRKKRTQTILRDNNECQRCKAIGKVTVGTKEEPLQVHHKRHLKDRPDLAFVDNNLESLCATCHNKEHPEKLEKLIGEKKKKGFENEERW